MQVLKQGLLPTRRNHMQILANFVRPEFLLIHLFARPTVRATDKPGLAARARTFEHLVVSLDVGHRYELRVLVLDVLRYHPALPVLSNAVASIDDSAQGELLIPLLQLVRQPDLHRDIGVTVHQRKPKQIRVTID